MVTLLHLVRRSNKKEWFIICSRRITNELYLLTPSTYEIHDIEINNRSKTLPLKRKLPSSNPTKLWHLRLGRINKLVKEGVLPPLIIELIPVSEPC